MVLAGEMEFWQVGVRKWQVGRSSWQVREFFIKKVMKKANWAEDYVTFAAGYPKIRNNDTGARPIPGFFSVWEWWGN
jgi:hypothetical protein